MKPHLQGRISTQWCPDMSLNGLDSIGGLDKCFCKFRPDTLDDDTAWLSHIFQRSSTTQQQNAWWALTLRNQHLIVIDSDCLVYCRLIILWVPSKRVVMIIWLSICFRWIWETVHGFFPKITAKKIHILSKIHVHQYFLVSWVIGLPSNRSL